MSSTTIPSEDDLMVVDNSSETSLEDGNSDDELDRLTDELNQYEDELHDLAIQLDTAENPVVGSSGRLGYCGITFKKAKARGRRQAESLEKVKENIRLVKEQKLAVKRALARIQSQISCPFQRLPAEVVGDIFSFCLPAVTFIQPSPVQAPLLLNQVCSSWRHISISNPRLWTSFSTSKSSPLIEESVEEPSPDDTIRKAEHRIAMASLWISRSGDLPLTIRGTITEEVLDRTLWAYLQAVERRWEKVDFDLTKVLDIEPFRREIPHPVLRAVCIRTPEGPIPAERPQNLSCGLMNAPHLHDFAWELPRFNAFTFLPTTISIHLNWAKMTRLVLYQALTGQECYDLLTTTPNIVSLTLEHVYSPSQVAGQLTLSSLSSVGLTCSHNFNPQFLFEALTLPALKDLLVNCQVEWPKPAFMNFMNRSRCKLQSLNFYYSSMTEDDLIEYLSANESTLTEITIQGREPAGHITDRILDMLTDNGTDPVWCPHLQIIALYDALNCSAGSAARMARSRLDPPGTSNDSATLVAGNRRRQSLRVMEIYENDSEVEAIEELTDLGLVLIKYDSTGKKKPFSPQDVEKLRQYQKEGLVLRSYASQIGFGPTENDDY